MAKFSAKDKAKGKQNSAVKHQLEVQAIPHDTSAALDLLETDLDIKSFIYQKLNEFSPYVTPESQIIVLARDPEAAYADETHVISEDIESEDDHYSYRIAIVIKEADVNLEAEGFGHDIYDAISAAVDAMLIRLCELQDEVESPQDRLKAIQQASENSQIH